MDGINDSDIKFETDFVPSDIFYVDNISVFDLKDLEILRLDHIVHIKEALEEDMVNNDSEILSKIQNIIKSDCPMSQENSSGIK